MKTVYTGGTFDLFHSGHVNFLRQCAILGKVVVSLNTDEFIREYKGNFPVVDYNGRRDTLLGCRYVSRVVPNTGGKDSKPAIVKVLPDIIAIGTDWLGKDYYKQMSFTQAWLDERNICLVYIPYTVGISTTLIKKKLCSKKTSSL